MFGSHEVGITTREITHTTAGIAGQDGGARVAIDSLRSVAETRRGIISGSNKRERECTWLYCWHKAQGLEITPDSVQSRRYVYVQFFCLWVLSHALKLLFFLIPSIKFYPDRLSFNFSKQFQVRQISIFHYSRMLGQTIIFYHSQVLVQLQTISSRKMFFLIVETLVANYSTFFRFFIIPPHVYYPFRNIGDCFQIFYLVYITWFDNAGIFSLDISKAISCSVYIVTVYTLLRSGLYWQFYCACAWNSWHNKPGQLIVEAKRKVLVLHVLDPIIVTGF